MGRMHGVYTSDPSKSLHISSIWTRVAVAGGTRTGGPVQGRPVVDGRPVVQGRSVVQGQPVVQAQPIVQGHPVPVGQGQPIPVILTID